MSTAVVSTSAALGRPFVFEDEREAEVGPEQSWFAEVHEEGSKARDYYVAKTAFDKLRAGSSADKNVRLRMPGLEGTKLASVTPASQLSIRPAPEMASCGISAIDSLTGGLPRGCLTEICGPASSGRTTVMLAALAAATRRGEYCVLVDANDALDPKSLAAAGVELDRLLWVRCGGISPQRSAEEARRKTRGRTKHRDEDVLEQLLRATDMLLESGGFGLIALDLCDLPLQTARRVPLTTWFRYRRAVEHTPTVLLAIEEHPIAGSCSSLLVKLGEEGRQELSRPYGTRCNSPLYERRPFGTRSVQSSSQSSPLNGNLRKTSRSVSENIVGGRKVQPQGRKPVSAGPFDGTAEAVPFPKPIHSHSASSANSNGYRHSNVEVNNFLQEGHPAHTELLTGLEITVEVTRSRLERKPAQSTSAAFSSQTAWTG